MTTMDKPVGGSNPTQTPSGTPSTHAGATQAAKAEGTGIIDKLNYVVTHSSGGASHAGKASNIPVGDDLITPNVEVGSTDATDLSDLLTDDDAVNISLLIDQYAKKFIQDQESRGLEEATFALNMRVKSLALGLKKAGHMRSYLVLLLMIGDK